MTSVVCNPVDLAYRYQDLRPLPGGRTVHREAADPAGRMPFDGPFSISGLRVFGTGDGPAPAAAATRARRVDDRTARIEWEPSPTAHGYNVRYGIAPGKLYHSWLVHEQHDLDLRTLNAGAGYWVAVDSFNENGVTTGPVTKIA